MDFSGQRMAPLSSSRLSLSKCAISVCLGATLQPNYSLSSIFLSVFSLRKIIQFFMTPMA